MVIIHAEHAELACLLKVSLHDDGFTAAAPVFSLPFTCFHQQFKSMRPEARSTRWVVLAQNVARTLGRRQPLRALAIS